MENSCLSKFRKDYKMHPSFSISIKGSDVIIVPWYYICFGHHKVPFFYKGYRVYVEGPHGLFLE